MDDRRERIAELLRRFVSGADRSAELAGELEVAIDTLFPDGEDWQDLVHALASYRPAGGTYLYDAQQIVPKCEWAIEALGARD